MAEKRSRSFLNVQTNGGRHGYLAGSRILSRVLRAIRELYVTHDDRHAFEKLSPLARPPAVKVFRVSQEFRVQCSATEEESTTEGGGG